MDDGSLGDLSVTSDPCRKHTIRSTKSVTVRADGFEKDDSSGRGFFIIDEPAV